jgi:hypothetical protein
MAGYSSLKTEKDIFIARKNELEELKKLTEESDNNIIYVQYGVGGIWKIYS